MSKYTISDVQEADDLWDEHPKTIVSERTGIPLGTLDDWAEKGLISTDVDHRAERLSEYPDETIEKADTLWDVMPLPKVSEYLDVPHATLRTWAEKEWISTEADHRGSHQTGDMPKKVRRAAYLSHDLDLGPREAADRMGVATSTYYRYLRLYRNGEYA